jgi:hypothetical protein
VRNSGLKPRSGLRLVPRCAPASDLGAEIGEPVLRNTANRHRAIPLTYDQFRYSFANAVEEDEAKELYDEFSVAGPGEPLFQAAAVNLNLWTEAKVDTNNPERGPMLIISADSDHTVPWAVAHASYESEQHNEGVTEIVKLEGRGHRSLGHVQLVHATPQALPSAQAATRAYLDDVLVALTSHPEHHPGPG